MRVPFLDLQAQNRSVWTELQAALEEIQSILEELGEEVAA